MKFTLEDDLWWAAQICLRSWAGYQSRRGPYGSINTPMPSDGTVSLIFAPEGRGIEPLNVKEEQLVSWFMHNELLVSGAVKHAVISWCSPDSMERTSRFDFDGDFPLVEDEAALKRNTGLCSVHIHQIEHGGLPYIGYEFGCEWEEEHRLGVLMHGTRLVHIGFADVAFVLLRAEQDMKSS